MRADNYFVQIPDWVTNSPISHGAYRLYGVLGTYASRDTNTCYPSYKTLAGRLGCSRRQVMNYTKELVDVGALAVRKRANPVSRSESDTNEYILLTTPPQVVKHSSPPSEDDFTTGGEAQFTGVVKHSSPKQEPINNNQLNNTPLTPQGVAPAAPKATSRGTRITEDFMPAQKHIDKIRAMKPGLNLDLEHTKFINYWLSATGSRATKKDWGRTWENWMLNARADNEYKPGWQKRLEFNAQMNQQYQHDPGADFLRSIEQ